MALSLTAAELGAVAAAQRVLLSPHDYAAVGAWCAAASETLRPLFGHDRLQAVIDAPPVAPYHLEGLGRDAVEAYLTHHVDRDPSAAPLLSGPVSSTGLAAWQLGREAAAAFYRSEVYNEYYLPNGMVHSYAMVAGGAGGKLLPRGRATLVVSQPVRDGEAVDRRRRKILSLLQPAFEAGVHAIIRAGTAAAFVRAGLEALDQPLLIVGPEGHPAQSTRALAEALAGEPAREAVLARAHALLRRAALLLCRPLSVGAPEKARDAVALPLIETVRTGTTTWRLRPVLFGEDVTGRPLVAVAVERVTPTLPAPETLVERFGLTPQEARVALLLAQRRRNAEVAEALGIRPSTARRHTERVFEKLGVHSRDDVRAVLLAA